MNELANTLKTIVESEIVIKSNENFVGMGLWNIGNELKYIRDNKTYTDKKYKSFEEYVENELDYSRRQTYNFISISEGYDVQSIAQIGHLGMVKLLELKKLDEPQREEFMINNPVDEMTTRELQKAIKEKQELEEKLKESIEFNKKAHELASLRGEERDEALKTLESAKKIAIEKSEEAKKLEDALQIEKDNLKKEKENAKKEIAELQSFIGEAQATGNNEEVERLQASLQEIQNDLDSSALRIDELEAQLKDKPIDVITAEPVVIEKIPEEVERELEELRNNSGQNTSQPVIRFKIYFAELQQKFREELEVMAEIKEAYPDTYEKCKRNVLNLINSMSERL